jgi:heavy metal efflux system protein
MKNINKIFSRITQIYANCIVKKNDFLAVPIGRICRQKRIALSVLICIICGQLSSQKINLDDAIKMALQNNNQIKNEQLKTVYTKALINTATDIPKTNIIAEYGQINSVYNDTKFGFSQNIALPIIYKKQKQLLNQDYNAALLSVSLKEYEIKKAVTQVFYAYIYLNEKQKILLQADTLYDNFYAKANLRLQKGESNVLEKTTAQSQKANIFIQLRQVKQALEITVLELQLLLNTNQMLEPFATTYKLPSILVTDSNSIINNPLIKIVQQQKLIAQAQTALEKTKLLPNFTLGYLNNSFKGTGADNNFYNGNTRFSSMQIGIDIPIFAKALKSKITASKLQENIWQNHYEADIASLKNQYKKILIAYNSNIEIVKYYENEALKNAELIIQTANKQFVNGEINYLDFVNLINQSIGIKSNYIEAVKAVNESIIALNFITLQK